MTLPLGVAAAAGYVLGALPFGFLVARAHGVDIFAAGSRNPGATNVRRVLGAGPGNTVLILDALKGAVAAGWPLFAVWGALRQFSDPKLPGYVGLAAAILGHSFSCFTRFRGGKGVATAAGGLLALLPLVGACAAALWVVAFLLFRYVSVASIAAAVSLPFLALAFRNGTIAVSLCAVVGVFVVIRHRANIARLATGTEKRFERKGARQPPGPP